MSAEPGVPLPSLDLRRAWRQPPAVATASVLRWTNLAFWVLGGLSLLLGSRFLARDTANADGVAVIGASAVVIGLVILVFGRGFTRPVFQLLTLVGTALITLAVVFGGGGSSALALSCPYLFVMINAALMFSLRSAVVHVVIAETAAVVTLASLDVAAGEILIVAGCKVGSAVVAGWLARVASAAEEDPLTGLLNRRGLDHRLQDAMRETTRADGDLTVAMLDIDDFKRVNEERGHVEGDRLLAQCARTWQAAIPAGVHLGREGGGNNFVLVMPGMPLGPAADLVDELRGLAPGGLTVSAGVATWRAGDSPSVLFGRADVALYDAKTEGRDRTVAYGDPDRTASQLESAIAEGQMRLYLQPVVDLATGLVGGYEALVRWQHPVRGLVMPGEFIPLAERTGAIRSLGAWILDESCRAVAAMPAPARRVAVNASVRELQSPDYVETVRGALERHAVPPELLVVEVAESAFDGQRTKVEETLRRLRELGILVAIDDFGAGYSSLRRLETLPIDVLKVDGALLASLRDGAEESPILEAIVTMGHRLGMTLVAEWVETEHQAQVLRRLGYDLGQGYLFGAPQPVDLASAT